VAELLPETGEIMTTISDALIIWGVCGYYSVATILAKQQLVYGLTGDVAISPLALFYIINGGIILSLVITGIWWLMKK
jgi:hypothetical protein